MNFLKQIIYSSIIPFIGNLNSGKNRYTNVIYYHDIVNGEGNSFMQTPIEIFKRHMKYISDKGFRTYTFDELDNNKCARDAKDGILITFDDGWVSNYSMIFDLMKTLGIKYNIFLAVEKIDNDPDYLTWDQIKMMHQSGIVGFGAHTYSHCNMRTLDGIDLDVEIHKANSVIKEKSGIEVKDFCFPYGAYSLESLDKIVVEGGYDRIYTSDLRYTYPMGSSLIFGRNGISCNESFGIFKNKLKGNFNVFNCLTKLWRIH